MLKIAEYNTITGEKIDLKQLEKYGFIKNDSYLFGRYLYINKCGTIQNRIYIYNNLHIAFGNINRKVLSTLYDLIKDGLVEKVEE